jgi:YD repeat-containing protein
LLRLNRPCNSSQSPLGCSARLDGSISGHLGTSQYTVNAAAGDQYLVRLLRSGPSGAFQPRADVYDSTGKLINTAIARGLSELTFSTATAGPYTLVVSDGADGSESGAYSFSLLRLNRPCNVTATLQCGTVATGAFAQPLDSSVYSFTPAAGASFSARMIDINGVLQPGLRVYDSQGNAVGQSASGNYTGVDVVQPAAPPYTVVAVDTSATPAGGPFAVDVLQTANACGSSPPQGQTVRGVVNPAKPFLSYSVSASAGDTLLLRSASSSPGFSAQMELYDPTGARLDAATFSISRKLAAAGSYTVILESSAARTEGSYSLSWQLLNNPAAASVLPCGGSATASLVPANEFRYYTASASAGDLMRLIFTNLSTGFSPQIELFDPAGQRLAQTSDISQKASAAGNYLVVVSPSTSTTETGSFTIAYQRPNHPCSLAALTCGQTSLRQVNLAGQLDAYTFSATGGDQADLRFIQRSGAYSPFAELYDSSGNRITTTAAGIMRYTPAATATYSLLVRDSAGVNTGSYRVSLQDDTTACPVNDTQKPVITLLKPTGGEVIPGGLLYRIQWLSDDNIGVATHDVALSTDGGRTFPTALASGLSGTTQSFDWGAPATIAPSRTAVIRVTATDAAGNAQAAASGPLSLIGSGFTPNSTAAYSYDGANRLTQATLGDGRSVQYVWDAAGNLTQITVTGQ